MRVLIVEDERDTASALARGFRRAGLAVDVAEDGEEALPKAAEVQDLAQPFRRGGRARVGDGHGLGLAIVQAVARAHQGTMTIERANHGGLSIEIRLPLTPGQAADTLSTRDGDDVESSAGEGATRGA